MKVDADHLAVAAKEHDYLAAQIYDNGTKWCAIHTQFLFTCAIITGEEKDLDWGWSRRFCYPTAADAVEALVEWKSRDFEDWPKDWIVSKGAGGDVRPFSQHVEDMRNHAYLDYLGE